MSSRTKDWLSRIDFSLLVVVGLICLCMWLFVEIAEEVGEGDHQSYEEQIVRSLRTPENPRHLIGPPWVEIAARDASALGGVLVLTMITVLTATHLLLIKQWRTALFVTLAVVSGVVLSTFLKSIFERSRPAELLHLMNETSPSFPSGHSMLSSVVYITLGALLARTVERKSVKLFFVTTALGLTFLVGISRVFLGVHYPTDVISGWVAGIAWALFCWAVASRYLTDQPKHRCNVPLDD